MSGKSLNAVYSSLTMKRRYEAWFLKLFLADGSGAWWFRYLLHNPGSKRWPAADADPQQFPVQVWASWFPAVGQPRSFLQGFPLDHLNLSPRGAGPFCFAAGPNKIEESSCGGDLHVPDGRIQWNLQYQSNFHTPLSNVGWIGFSRTPHADAVFQGEIVLNGIRMKGEPLGFGVQGHNCGYRHRHLWNWSHGLARPAGERRLSSFEVLVYEIPLGMKFRKAIWWHRGEQHIFRQVRELHRDRGKLQWALECRGNAGEALLAVIDGQGPASHRLPYLRTDGCTTFEVINNSLAQATYYWMSPGKPWEVLTADAGAVLEMTGD